jgi:hypothetical protein
MATTTNYGWTTPDDTSLVKDGASAIRTLGSSIDTTLKAQIDAQIPDTLLTTTGDVIYASAANTPARLGIGTTGQVLAVSGGLPVWTTASSGGMTLISTISLTGASVTLSSISSSYKEIVIYVQAYTGTNSDTLRMRFNGVTTSVYGSTNTTSITNLSKTAQNSIILSGPAASNGEGFMTITIPNYTNTNTAKTMVSSAFTGNPSFPTQEWNYQRYAGIWNSTAVINSITLLPASSGFTGGTALFYGVS